MAVTVRSPLIPSDSRKVVLARGGPSVSQEKALFSCGYIRVSGTAAAYISSRTRNKCILRHASGDYGCASDAVVEANRLALADGDQRILSAYPVNPKKKAKRGAVEGTFWIITEADRKRCYQATCLSR